MTHYTKTALLLFGSLLFTGRAVADTMPLGYCNVTENPTGDLSDNTAGVWSSGAIFIPASTAATLSGKKITAIKFGINLKLNIESAKVWIRTDLDGPNLAEQTVDATTTPALAIGWNEATLDEGWTVPEGCEGFYLGYSVLQKGYSYALSNSPAPCRNGLFVNMAEKGWEDMSAKGTLYLQATVDGDDLPGINLGIASASLEDVYQIGTGATKASLRVNNLGSKATSAFDVTMLNGDEEVAKTRVEGEITPGTSREFDVNFTPAFTKEGQYQLTLRVDNIAEGADIDPTDNTFSQTMNVMGGALQRVVLVEEFSTEKCQNCPAAAAKFHSLLQQPAYKNRIAPVVHHAGFYTDSFTKSWDTEYVWFYNGSEFAPAFMVDRYAGNAARPVMQSAELESNLQARLNDEPKLSLTIEAGYDVTDDSKIIVVVRGTKYTREPICEEPYITIWLNEDNVKAVSQAGASGNFIHQHVTRDVNSTWGRAITFDGDDFEYTYTFANVDPSWKKEDLMVVGAVHPRKGSNPATMEVANACFIAAADFTPQTGMGGVTDIMTGDTEAEAEYYTLTGTRVNAGNLTPGIYIRRIGSKSDKIIVK